MYQNYESWLAVEKVIDYNYNQAYWIWSTWYISAVFCGSIKLYKRDLHCWYNGRTAGRVPDPENVMDQQFQSVHY